MSSVTKVKIGSATLYCGDCLEVMSEMSDECVDVTVTSPPYNMGLIPGGGGKGMRIVHSEAELEAGMVTACIRTRFLRANMTTGSGNVFLKCGGSPSKPSFTIIGHASSMERYEFPCPLTSERPFFDKSSFGTAELELM